MLVLIAWRNIVRNRKRSITTIFLSASCVALLIFFDSFMQGSHNKMIRDSVEIYSGYVQVVGHKFQDYPDYDHLIYDTEAILKGLHTIAGIDAMTSRLETFALYSGPEASVAGMLVGIDPENEAKISRIKRALKKGRYLKADDKNAIYIGEDLAERLEVSIGDEVTVLSSALDYSFAADIFIVEGIFKTQLYDFDNTTAFINERYMDDLFLSHNISSHIIIKPATATPVPALKDTIIKGIDSSKYTVLTWRDVLKGMVQAVELDSVFGYFSLSILIMVLFFVIMIFSLLTVFQRIKEIGIMRAIGTTPRRIFFVLLVEMVILSLVSIVIGGAIGSALSYYFQIHPLVIKGIEEVYKQYGIIDSSFPALLSMQSVLFGVITIFLVNVVAILYPAYKINRMEPIDAIQERGYY